jgi:hypothetical protein
MAFSVVYSTSSFPPDLNEEKDIASHEKLMEKGVGLVNLGGTIIRCVDFKPGYACMMHRTQSLESVKFSFQMFSLLGENRD